MGRLQFARLMHPDYVAGYDELAGWPQDLWRPASTRCASTPWPSAAQPGGVADLAPPVQADPTADATWARVEVQAERIAALSAPGRTVDAKVQAAREAYYAGDVKKALTLASRVGGALDRRPSRLPAEELRPGAGALRPWPRTPARTNGPARAPPIGPPGPPSPPASPQAVAAAG